MIETLYLKATDGVRRMHFIESVLPIPMPSKQPHRADTQFTMKELEPLVRMLDPTCPERLREVTELLYMQLIETEGPSNESRMESLAQLAILQADRLATAMGGMTFYMPKGFGFALARRDRQIVAEFNGRNFSELSRKFLLSDMRIRQIVGRNG